MSAEPLLGYVFGDPPLPPRAG